MSPPPATGADRLRCLVLLGALLVASAGIHAWLLLTTQGAAFDIASYRLQAYAALHWLNVYDYTARYPYPPVWIWLVGAMAELSRLTGIPFTIAIKLPATTADLLMTVLLFEYQRSRGGWRLAALLPAALWALNPIPALVAAGHGQFDSLPMLFALLAFHLRGPDQKSRPYLAALSLGVAVALKGYPALLLPLLALSAAPGKRLPSLLVAGIPVAAATALYVALLGFSPRMIAHVAGYPSTLDIGWGNLLYGRVPIALLSVFVLVAPAAIMAFATLVVPILFRGRVELGAAAVFAFFYLATCQGSVQYLVWGLPFFVLALPRISVLYSVSGTALLVGFYAFRIHGALPSGLGLPFDQLAILYPVGLVAVIASGGAALLAALLAARARPAPLPAAA